MNRRTLWMLLALLALLAFGLWYTNPMRLFPECQGDEVPRHCVD